MSSLVVGLEEVLKATCCRSSVSSPPPPPPPSGLLCPAWPFSKPEEELVVVLVVEEVTRFSCPPPEEACWFWFPNMEPMLKEPSDKGLALLGATLPLRTTLVVVVLVDVVSLLLEAPARLLFRELAQIWKAD